MEDYKEHIQENTRVQLMCYVNKMLASKPEIKLKKKYQELTRKLKENKLSYCKWYKLMAIELGY